MKLKSQDFVLGVVVVAMIVLFVGSVTFLAPRAAILMRTVEVRFEHDSGLTPIKPGSPVVLGGALQVGKVIGVRREYASDGMRLMIVATLSLDSDLQLYEDVEITTDQPPVGGTGIVVIRTVGSPGTKPHLGGPIDGLPPQSLAAAIGLLSAQVLGPNGLLAKVDRELDAERADTFAFKVRASLDDVNAITGELRRQVDAGQSSSLLGKMHSVMDGVSESIGEVRTALGRSGASGLLARVDTLLESLGHAVESARAMLEENRAPLRSTVARLESASATLNDDLLASVRAEMDRENPDGLLGKLHRGMDRLNAGLADLESSADGVEHLVTVSGPQLERTLANARAMSEQLKLASDEIRVAPWRLLYRPSAGETQKMSVFEAARTFAEAATYLDDAAARLEAVTASAARRPDDAAAQAEVRAIRDAVREAFARFQKAETYLYEQLR